MTTKNTQSFDDIIDQLESEIASVESEISGLQNRIHEVQMATELKKNEVRKRASADVAGYTAPRLHINSSKTKSTCSEKDVKQILQSMYQ